MKSSTYVKGNNYTFFHYRIFFVEKYIKDCEVSHIVYFIIIIVID